jgi:CHASE2 domain-containing sensor protein
MRKKVSAYRAFLATLFISFITWLITLVPLNDDMLNPIAMTFNDFRHTDIYYSHIKESPKASDEIVLVNIGNLPRRGIAEMINIVNRYEPKVIGVDVFFRDPKDPIGDSLLQDAFSRCKNLILVSELYENYVTESIDSVGYSHPMFMQNAEAGFADLVTAGRDQFKVSRECIPQQVYKSDTLLSFPVLLAKMYNPEAAEKFLARDNELEEINYQGNIITHTDGLINNSKNVFFALDVAQLFEEEFEPEMLKDKIVILGFMGAFFGDPSWEDKFFTPLNPNYIGKTNPDMFGVVAHANIVAMILKGDFINLVPDIWVLIISVIILFLNTWMFAWLFHNLGEWWDGISMLVSIIEVLILTSISMFTFHLFNYKFDITLVVLALFLTESLTEVYFGLVTKLFRRAIKKTKKIFPKRKKKTVINKPTETYEV